jgi:hypothetical protein
MPISVKELKACTIVNYKISRSGGQKYERENEETSTDPVTGEEVKTWDTKKLTKDPKEFKEAASLQSKAKYALGSLGAHSPMGVILRRDKREEAEKLAEEWERKISEFNTRSTHTDIEAWITIWDLEGRNINQLEKVLDRMFSVLGELQEALDSFNPENINNVLQKMSGYSEILPDAAADAFDRAVKNARTKRKGIMKYEGRAQRMMERIEAEVEGMDPEQVLAERERLVKQMEDKQDEFSREQLPEMKKRVFSLRKAVNGRKDALVKLEETKASINDSAVSMARFAVMKRRPGMDESDDASGQLQGAQQGRRFARIAGRVPAEPQAANDA